jgi:hypothetical protein
VSGSIASLAASATTSVSFDLGETWDAYTLVQVTVDPAAPETALNTVTAYGTDIANDITMPARVLGQAGASGLSQAVFTNIAPATGAQSFFVRPNGRFVTVKFQNNDATNALGATSQINFAAYIGA